MKHVIMRKSLKDYEKKKARVLHSLALHLNLGLFQRVRLYNHFQRWNSTKVVLRAGLLFYSLSALLPSRFTVATNMYIDYFSELSSKVDLLLPPLYVFPVIFPWHTMFNSSSPFFCSRNRLFDCVVLPNSTPFCIWHLLRTSSLVIFSDQCIFHIFH